MRSILPFLLLCACRAIPEEKTDDTAGHNLEDTAVQTDSAEDTGTETGTVDTDTAPIETGDTATTGDTTVVEPTGFVAEWVVEHETVVVDEFVLPRLLTYTTNNSLAYTVASLNIFVGIANDPWLTMVDDSRLGVGTADQHLNVYSAVGNFCGSHPDGNTYCSLEWQIDTTSFALPVYGEHAINFGFSMAFFYEDEMVAEILELHDDEDDLVRVYAVVAWAASDGTSGEVTTEEFFTITAE